MTAFLFGFAACYIMGAVIVYRERQEYFARNAEVPEDVSELELLKLAVKWPWTISGK